MSNIPESLLDAAMQLPLDARAGLANRLLESLEPADDSDFEAAWADEIAKRIDDIAAGREPALSLTQALKVIMDDSDDAN